MSQKPNKLLQTNPTTITISKHNSHIKTQAERKTYSNIRTHIMEEIAMEITTTIIMAITTLKMSTAMPNTITSMSSLKMLRHQ
jgi:hypothetical protein